jgi:hypothetical protein
MYKHDKKKTIKPLNNYQMTNLLIMGASKLISFTDQILIMGSQD